MRQHSPILSYGLTVCSVLAIGCRDEQPATVIEPVLNCQLLVCEGASECVATSDGALCQCSVGYQGSGCDRCESGYHRDSLDRCVPDRSCAEHNPCGAHGTCSDESGVVECRCEAPFAGPRCSVCAAPYRLTSAGSCATLASDAGSLDASQSQLDSSLLDAQAPADASVADATVEPTPDAASDGATTDAELDASTMDASVDAASEPDASPADAGPDAASCTMEMVRADFEALTGWPTTSGNCTGVDALTADGLTVRSREGDRVMRCAPTSSGTMNTRHIELTASAQRAAELSFSRPINLLRMRFGARTAELRVDVWTEGRLVGSLQVPAWKSSTAEIALDPPVRSLQLKSGNVYNQQLCLDDLEYRALACP